MRKGVFKSESQSEGGREGTVEGRLGGRGGGGGERRGGGGGGSCLFVADGGTKLPSTDARFPACGPVTLSASLGKLCRVYTEASCSPSPPGSAQCLAGEALLSRHQGRIDALRLCLCVAALPRCQTPAAVRLWRAFGGVVKPEGSDAKGGEEGK